MDTPQTQGHCRAPQPLWPRYRFSYFLLCKSENNFKNFGVQACFSACVSYIEISNVRNFKLLKFNTPLLLSEQNMWNWRQNVSKTHIVEASAFVHFQNEKKRKKKKRMHLNIEHGYMLQFWHMLIPHIAQDGSRHWRSTTATRRGTSWTTWWRSWSSTSTWPSSTPRWPSSPSGGTRSLRRCGSVPRSTYTQIQEELFYSEVASFLTWKIKPRSFCRCGSVWQCAYQDFIFHLYDILLCHVRWQIPQNGSEHELWIRDWTKTSKSYRTFWKSNLVINITTTDCAITGIC